MDAPKSLRLSTGIVNAGSCHPLIRVPTGFGGITLTKAYFDPGIATIGLGTSYLIDAGTALGPGTEGTLGTIDAADSTFVADVPGAWNLTSTPYLAEGHWLGIICEAASTASGAVVIEYKPGK